MWDLRWEQPINPPALGPGLGACLFTDGLAWLSRSVGWGDKDVSGITLIADLTSCHEFVKSWTGPVKHFLNYISPNIMQALGAASRLKSALAYGTNAATGALSVARFMGFTEVAFVGHDYGIKFSGCSSCGHEWFESSHADGDFPESIRKGGTDPKERSKGHDGEYMISRTMMFQKLWTEMAIQNFQGISFTNCSEGGCLGIDPGSGKQLPFVAFKKLEEYALERSGVFTEEG